ncbi:Nramp family divalent metal transporter [uncultured Desulfobulbus sp.]|uniref:Nramp family divalent metal transporter n=1 Tax=uncultured Desulfobulbus sp. TaxID=239745 RepID=UPI0029C95D20|nr:Nramp family divalent metal transporter [uncultured Desulfobulbus sp.]
MNLRSFWADLRRHHKPTYGALQILRYIGPGLLVTVGFIDPGNWASNIAAGAEYGYELLWMVTLSTVMLIVLQHNVAHLGIVSGLCLSEATNKYAPPWISRIVLGSAMLASISTSLAEILGGAIALNMLCNIPMPAGAFLVVCFVAIMLFTNSYRAVEKIIIGFVSVIGLSFLYELTLVNIDWASAGIAWITPSFPKGSIMIIMSVLGAVVMPHNLFLHSEIIQSRQWNLENEAVIKKQLDYELFDTLLSMLVGWAINSAIILLAATTFFTTHTPVSELQQAQSLLTPLLGNNAAVVFAVALLFAGGASTVTSAIAGGSIFAGIYDEPYDIKDTHSRLGVFISLIGAFLLLLLVNNAFKALIVSQMVLSIQLPLTICMQIYLTSSPQVMGKHVNPLLTKIMLWTIAAVVSGLNVLLFISFF